MVRLVLAEGHVLEQVLETESSTATDGLSIGARSTLASALARTTWGRSHQRQMALVDGDNVLASAVQYDLTAVLDEEPVRVCGIGRLCLHQAAGTGIGSGSGSAAATLVEQLCVRGRDDGAALAMLFSNSGEPDHFAAFDSVHLTDAELHVTESSRHGAPMTLIRGGEPRDLDAIVAMGRTRATPFRFHLDRDTDFVQHAIIRKRLLAGLAAAGARELHFFIAEEGITAAAYVVISVISGSWTLEECGDRDPTGARVGAILQALIARAPGERRPTIRGWLPPGFLPPQVTVTEAAVATETLRVRWLESNQRRTGLSTEGVMYWRGDVL